MLKPSWFYSGRRRSTHRGAVEQFPSIDFRVLRRAGLLSAGECTYTTLHWGNQTLEALSARIFIDLTDGADASMRIISSGDRDPITQRVAIECKPCPYAQQLEPENTTEAAPLDLDDEALIEE